MGKTAAGGWGREKEEEETVVFSDSAEAGVERVARMRAAEGSAAWEAGSEARKSRMRPRKGSELLPLPFS